MLCAITFGMAGCDFFNSYSKSDKEYWFSSVKVEYVEYDEENEDMEVSDAGTFWYFTSNQTADITMSMILDVGYPYSGAYLYVNGEQMEYQGSNGIYTHSYNLSLKKGDKIVVHAFTWNSLMLEHYSMTYLSINDGEHNYLVMEKVN